MEGCGDVAEDTSCARFCSVRLRKRSSLHFYIPLRPPRTLPLFLLINIGTETPDTCRLSVHIDLPQASADAGLDRGSSHRCYTSRTSRPDSPRRFLRPDTREMYIQERATMLLEKRDNMGFALSPALIIFLVILGGGALVCIGFAFYRFYGDDADQHHWTHRTPEQDAYMKEVRERTWRKLPKPGARHLHTPSSQHLAHAPLSPR